MKSGTDTEDPHRIIAAEFDDPLMFNVAPSRSKVSITLKDTSAST